VLFLLVTLGLSLWLGYQAVDAARSHRRTAEGVLSDYAGIAVWEYSTLVRENLDYFYRWVFDDIPYSLRRRRAPHPEAMAEDMHRTVRNQRCACRGLRERTLYFRIDLADSTVVSEPDTLSDSLLRRLTEKVVTHRSAHPEDRFGLLTVGAGDLIDSPGVIVYLVSLGSDEEDRLAYGFVADTDAMGELFSAWYRSATLLPTTVESSQPSDSVMQVAVRGTDDVTVFESLAAYPPTYSARDTLEGEYGDLVVEAAIRPDAASLLIIGGLPRSKIPLLLGLMLLTLGVGAASLLQIRREHQLARLRDDFISGVSHEFRTPLTQIRVFAELLNDDKLKTEEERKRSTGVINREARRLTHLVENILHFSRLRRMPPTQGDVEEIEIEGAVAELTEAFAPQAEASQARVETEVEPGATVLAGREGLHRILANLMDNALKYGGQGQVVRVRTRGSGGVVRISVEDEGPGVSPRDRRQIWDPYRRLERDVAGEVQGSGIGLAVVSELCSLYGGEAWVEDGEAGGSRFVVELPAGRGTPEDAKPENATPEAPPEDATTGPRGGE
jgi:signal transduction histidine kinase